MMTELEKYYNKFNEEKRLKSRHGQVEFITSMKYIHKYLPKREHGQVKILDVGAGSGCHALALQEMGKEVCAIDISPLSNEVMKQRGVNDPRLINLFDETFSETFDTILMLMNGSGIIGRLNNMPEFFQRMKRILHPGGCIFMDSSDLRYLFEEEDGSIVIDLAGDYYGEIDFQMQYKDVKGDTFDWLYVDFQTLSLYASECGFKAELIKEGKHYDYLVKLSIA